MLDPFWFRDVRCSRVIQTGDEMLFNCVFSICEFMFA